MATGTVFVFPTVTKITSSLCKNVHKIDFEGVKLHKLLEFNYKLGTFMVMVMNDPLP